MPAGVIAHPGLGCKRCRGWCCLAPDHEPAERCGQAGGSTLRMNATGKPMLLSMAWMPCEAIE